MNKALDISKTLVLGAVIGALLLPAAFTYPNLVIIDDGYFALQIAYHIGVNFMSSFDGIHITNGYHLLWNWSLGVAALILSPLTTGKGWFAFVALSIAAAIAVHCARTYFRFWWQRIFVVVMLLATASMTEAVLLTVALLYLFDRALEHDEQFLTSPADIAVAGLISMIRFDAAVLLAVLAAYYLVFDSRKGMVLTATLAAGAALQLATMQLFFGTMFSVSSQILSSRTARLPLLTLWNPEEQWASNTHAVCLLASFGLAAAALVGSMSIDRRERRYTIMAIVAACLCYELPHFTLGSMREWYWTAPLIGLFYVACKALDDRPARLLGLQILALGAVAMVAVNFGSLGRKHQDAVAYSAEFLQALKVTVPVNEKIFQEDASGFMGYWSERTVVNGDGLVNSVEYMQRLRTWDLSGYLADEDICFIVRNWPPEKGQIISLGGLELLAQDAHLLLYPPHGLRLEPPFQFKLYLLKDPRCQRLAYLARDSP